MDRLTLPERMTLSEKLSGKLYTPAERQEIMALAERFDSEALAADREVLAARYAAMFTADSH